jgi:hypothetical protein
MILARVADIIPTRAKQHWVPDRSRRNAGFVAGFGAVFSNAAMRLAVLCTSRRMAKFGSLIAFAGLTVVLPAAAVAAMLPGEQVVMQGLDKVTARVSTFEATIDELVSFGALRIVVRKCERTRPEEPPESSAFLDIYEARLGEPPADLFHGWMFASSPALSALEHPVYDVWVLECKMRVPVDSATD